MEVVSLACNECGAPLSVLRTTKFATCRHCGANLAVKHSSEVSFTEVIEQISERAGRLEDEIFELQRKNRLDSLSRRWQRTRRRFMIQGENGDWNFPAPELGYVASVIGAIVFVGSGIAGELGLSLSAFAVAGVSWLYARRAAWKLASYDAAKADYRRRQMEVLREKRPEDPENEPLG